MRCTRPNYDRPPKQVAKFFAAAPTVAISQASLVEVMNVLGTAGFAPAGEDANGAIVAALMANQHLLGAAPEILAADVLASKLP